MKLLDAVDIDGTVKAISTNHTFYTVPSGKQTVVSVIEVCNRTTSAIRVRLAHVQSGQTLANKNYILYDYSVPARGFVEVTARAMATGDFLVAYSPATGVNFIAWGDEIE